MADSRQRIISLQSFNKIHGTTDNFICDFNNISNIHWFAIQDIHILLSHYQIDASNNVLTFNEGGGNLTATLKDGNYTASSIASELKTKLDAAGGQVYTVTTDSINGKITISAAANFSLLWSLNPSLAKTLGFNVTDLTGANTYTSQGPLNLNRRFTIFNIYSTQLTRYHGSVHGSDKQGNLLVRAINSTAPPETYFKYSQDDHANYLIKYDPSARTKEIDIRITDIDNKPIIFNTDEIVVNLISYIR